MAGEEVFLGQKSRIALQISILNPAEMTDGERGHSQSWTVITILWTPFKEDWTR